MKSRRASLIISVAIMLTFTVLHGAVFASTLHFEANPQDSIEEVTVETTTEPTAAPTPTSTPSPTPTQMPITVLSQSIADTETNVDEEVVVEEMSTFEELREYFSEDDIVMMAQLIHAEAGSVYPLNRRAAVAWTVLNRMDNGYSSSCTSIAGTIKEPGQFAWYSGCSYSDLDYQIAEDVLTRWATEQITGQPDEGRVLPSCYMFFWGDGSQNHFNDGKGNYWDYSVDYDPYEDWA